jgi:hypothetical protein
MDKGHRMQEPQELPQRIDGAVGRSMAARQMLAIAKRTAKTVQSSVGQAIQKVVTKRAAAGARESILRDLEGFDRELRELDTPADGSQSGELAPKRKRNRVRVDWNSYIPGGIRQPREHSPASEPLP